MASHEKIKRAGGKLRNNLPAAEAFRARKGNPAETPLPQVTLVQYRILEYLAKGWPSKLIADALGMTESAVNHQKEKLRDKFNVKNGPALVFATWEYLRKVKPPVDISPGTKSPKRSK